MEDMRIDPSQLMNYVSSLLEQAKEIEQNLKKVSESAATTATQMRDVDGTVGDVKAMTRGIVSSFDEQQSTLTTLKDSLEDMSNPVDVSAISESLQLALNDNFVELQGYLEQIQTESSQVNIPKEWLDARREFALELLPKLNALDMTDMREKSDGMREQITQIQQNSTNTKTSVADIAEKIRSESPFLSRLIFSASDKNRKALLTELDDLFSSQEQESHYAGLLSALSEHNTEVNKLERLLTDVRNELSLLAAEARSNSSSQETESDSYGSASGFHTTSSGASAYSDSSNYQQDYYTGNGASPGVSTFDDSSNDEFSTDSEEDTDFSDEETDDWDDGSTWADEEENEESKKAYSSF